MVRKFFDWLEEWVDDDNTFFTVFKLGGVAVFFLAVIMTPLFYFVSRQTNKDMAACEASGGRWVAIGQHTSTAYVMVGKVMVPSTSQVTEYGCVGVRTR